MTDATNPAILTRAQAAAARGQLHDLSSTRLALSAIRETARHYLGVLGLGWTKLVPLYLLQVGFGQFFSYATDYLRQTGREDILFIAIIAGLELVFSLLWSAAWILTVAAIAQEFLAPISAPISAPVGEPSGDREPNLARSFVDHFNAVVIEEVRSLAAVLWRVPLLILPALIEYIRLSFVPLVVVLDPAYDSGQVDALERSRQLVSRHFWLLTFTVLFSLALPWWVEEIAQGDGGSWVWTNPSHVVFGWILTLLLNLGTSLFLYFLFRGRWSPPPAPLPFSEGPPDAQSSAFSMDGR